MRRNRSSYEWKTRAQVRLANEVNDQTLRSDAKKAIITGVILLPVMWGCWWFATDGITWIFSLF